MSVAEVSAPLVLGFEFVMGYARRVMLLLWSGLRCGRVCRCVCDCVCVPGRPPPGWEPDLERWESDEDSEDSDVERDGDEAALILIRPSVTPK